MPSASILTFSGTQLVSAGSPSSINVAWDTETKYLDGDVDFFDAGTDDEGLVIPAAIDGEYYEVFTWLEDQDDTWSSGTGGVYMGLGTNPAGLPNCWGIRQGKGRASWGQRTGPVLAASGPGTWRCIIREFEAVNLDLDGAKCRFGVISGNPVPRAIAAFGENFDPASASETDIAASETFDTGDIYNPATGVFTAPAGAELCVAGLMGYTGTSFSTQDVRYRLYQEGSEIAGFYHALSGRGPCPGNWGLFPVSPGDEIKMTIQDPANRDFYLNGYCEFY